MTALLNNINCDININTYQCKDVNFRVTILKHGFYYEFPYTLISMSPPDIVI